MAKPIKSLELHYLMIQFLTNIVIQRYTPLYAAMISYTELYTVMQGYIPLYRAIYRYTQLYYTQHENFIPYSSFLKIYTLYFHL